jgi:putative ABC transport system ATP-binding protein
MTLEIKNINLTLGSELATVNILNNISLTIPKSQRVGIVGASGSGKSSLMMLIGGLEQATSGDIYFDGENITKKSEDELALWRSSNCGIVFQSFHLIDTLTALENVALPLEISGVKNANDIAIAELEAVGLSHRLHHLPTELSGGEQQRVALARAFAPRPKLILADEPTGNLDEITGEAIIELMFKRQQQVGATLILITHDNALASKCERRIRLSNGMVAKDITL